MPETAAETGTGIAAAIKQHGLELGFQQVGISDIDLSDAEQQLAEWLARDFHGDMQYMQKHGNRRTRPAELVPGTLRVISARMDYYPEDQAVSRAILDDSDKAYVSRYALGRDYHKVLRGRLKKLAKFIEDLVGPLGHRVFVDSAPVLEKPLAQKAGLGWIGKHTNLINKDAGSWFFLGELFVDIDLPVDKPANDHCGSCRACIDVCPTKAIVAPYVLDARRCISYLTIENRNSIPLEFRKAIGNRIYGCDDCQLFCPWNKFAKTCVETDFAARHDLDVATLLELFAWDEDEWLARTEGSAIRRLSFEQWLRNIAVALGNVDTNETVIAALRKRKEFDSALVREHVCWALAQHGAA